VRIGVIWRKNEVAFMSFKDRWHQEKARKAAQKSARSESQESLSVAIAWYSEEDWNNLTEVVPDRGELDETYQDWEKSARDALQMLRDEGIAAVPVMIKVAELKDWCEAQGRPIDGEARAAYVNYVQSLHP
jgi:hypothetical protein